MEKIVATVSQFATAEDYTTMSEKVDEVDAQLQQVHNSLVTFKSDHDTLHREEKKKYNKELNQMRLDIHYLRVSLRWALVAILCSGVAIIALCMHLIS